MVCSAHPPISPLLKICFLPFSGVAKTTGPESENAGFDNFKGGQGGSAQQESEAPQIATPVVREAPKSGVTTLVLVEVEKYKKCCGAGVAV